MPITETAPESAVDGNGAPRFGLYSGRITDSGYGGLQGKWQRGRSRQLAAEKRWQYVMAASRSLVVGGAIVRLGYLASAFVYVFDRMSRKMLVQRSWVLPPMLVRVSDSPRDASASMRRMRSRMEIHAGEGGGSFRARLKGGVRIELDLDTAAAPPPLTAICPVEPVGVNLTQKTTCVPASGEVRIGGSTWRVSDAMAVLDYSHGLLARETSWRWASGSGRLKDGRLLGLNLVSGFNDGDIRENGLWVDGRLLRLGRASFEFNPREPMAPWSIRTDDGRVDLRFAPEGMRSEDIDVKLVMSRYVQPIGSFSGTVRDETGEVIQVEGIPGITEHHAARW